MTGPGMDYCDQCGALIDETGEPLHMAHHRLMTATAYGLPGMALEARRLYEQVRADFLIDRDRRRVEAT
jgi:hypothetical protein